MVLNDLIAEQESVNIDRSDKVKYVANATWNCLEVMVYY